MEIKNIEIVKISDFPDGGCLHALTPPCICRSVEPGLSDTGYLMIRSPEQDPGAGRSAHAHGELWYTRKITAML